MGIIILNGMGILFGKDCSSSVYNTYKPIVKLRESQLLSYLQYSSPSIINS